MYSSDSTTVITFKIERDKYLHVQEQIVAWRDQRIKGSMTLYFDGSGRIPRFTVTYEGC
jgi:hypothetical protein